MAQLIVHGHFYQPPRENPWTERVPTEAGAAPFHNWNDRIYAECYRANAYSRFVNAFNQIDRIVNTYELLSFNFGPTLLSWMKRLHPDTVARLVEADRQSAKRLGHGNAIGQAYNHAILPLCNERDRKTQIRWGIADFEHYFGRRPASLWLPETAVDVATCDDLIEEGLSFILLSPFQASRVRRLDSNDWTSAAEGKIDTSRPYRIFHSDGSKRYIDAFFYDGDVAQSIAFGGSLHSSQELIERLAGAAKGPLVNVATDGESYGHHTKFGDRTIAYALAVEAEKHGLELTNYAAHLESHPPEFEVELSTGTEGKGTSWSCIHGVGRWYRDCGCHTGGQPGWTQAWRTPLREALDHVRNAGTTYFEHEGSKLFDDPWAVRDAYIQVILDPEDTHDAFLEEHVKKPLTLETRTRALSLLQMQRNSMLMYTSCGWFFNDVSGIETVQVMKYAARVIDLFHKLSLPSPEDKFFELLSEAKSNLPEQGNGADIYQKSVRPYIISPPRMAAHFALFDLAVDDHRPEIGDAGGFHYEASHQRLKHGRVTVSAGKLRLRSRATEHIDDLRFCVLHFGGADFYCTAGELGDEKEHRESLGLLWREFKTASLPTLLRLAREHFGPREFGLEHVLPDIRTMLSQAVFGHLVNRFSDEYALLYSDSQRTLEMLRTAGFTLPAELRAAAQFTLARRLEREIFAQHQSLDPADYKKAIEIAEEASHQGLKIDRPAARDAFSQMITEATRAAAETASETTLDVAISVLELTERLGIRADLQRSQEIMFDAREKLGGRAVVLRLADKLGLTASLFR